MVWWCLNGKKIKKSLREETNVAICFPGGAEADENSMQPQDIFSWVKNAVLGESGYKKRVNCSISLHDHYWTPVSITDCRSITLHLDQNCQVLPNLDTEGDFSESSQHWYSILLSISLTASPRAFDCREQNTDCWRSDVDSWICLMWCLLIQKYVLSTVCFSYTGNISQMCVPDWKCDAAVCITMWFYH